jgi:hypothetical protein
MGQALAYSSLASGRQAAAVLDHGSSLILVKPVVPHPLNLTSSGRAIPMEANRTLYRLTCRTCSQHGELWITDTRPGGWAFAAVGFIGLAVNRHNPQNSVMRCNACWGPHVTVEPDREPEQA